MLIETIETLLSIRLSAGHLQCKCDDVFLQPTIGTLIVPSCTSSTQIVAIASFLKIQTTHGSSSHTIHSPTRCFINYPGIVGGATATTTTTDHHNHIPAQPAAAIDATTTPYRRSTAITAKQSLGATTKTTATALATSSDDAAAQRPTGHDDDARGHDRQPAGPSAGAAARPLDGNAHQSQQPQQQHGPSDQVR